MAKLRVVVVDDREVVRRRVTELLNNADHMAVVGEASTAAQVARLGRHRWLHSASPHSHQRKWG